MLCGLASFEYVLLPARRTTTPARWSAKRNPAPVSAVSDGSTAMRDIRWRARLVAERLDHRVEVELGPELGSTEVVESVRTHRRIGGGLVAVPAALLGAESLRLGPPPGSPQERQCGIRVGAARIEGRIGEGVIVEVVALEPVGAVVDRSQFRAASGSQGPRRGPRAAEGGRPVALAPAHDVLGRRRRLRGGGVVESGEHQAVDRRPGGLPAHELEPVVGGVDGTPRLGSGREPARGRSVDAGGSRRRRFVQQWEEPGPEVGAGPHESAGDRDRSRPASPRPSGPRGGAGPAAVRAVRGRPGAR